MSKKVIFDKKNVLVAGGAGFIGSHLCDELVKDAKVICVDNFSTGDERNIDHLLSEDNFKFVKHDMTEALNLDDLPELQSFKIQFQGIQEVYNLANPMSISDFEENRLPTLMSNSYAVKNALDMAVRYEAAFLHFSSSVVYGPRRLDNKKVLENDIGQVDFLSARSAYDEGKRFAETIVKNYQLEYGLDAKIMRLFRTYGPRMKLNDKQLIPDLIDSALVGEDMVIYGNENFSSSFCYVTDVIDAAVKLIHSRLKIPVNIGSDVLVNFTEFARMIARLTDSKSEIKYSDDLLFLTPLCLPDISQARNELNWMPIVPLEKGLLETINYHRASKNLLGVNREV